MAIILGTGSYRYEVVDNWATLPPGREFNADVAAVGVDKQDRVYAFNRGAHPMVVFDRDGNFLRSWGEGVFRRAHGVHMAPDDTIWLTDDGDHTVRHCTLDGKVLLTLGIPDKPKPYMSGEPFHRCTHTALSPQGDLYVSDGYGNARVHKFAPNGTLLFSWGEPGTDPGQFNIAHNICCDADGWVYVADRENHRVQVFDGNGRYETQWNNMHRLRACSSSAAPSRASTSARSAAAWRSTTTCPTSGHGSASTLPRARCWRGSASVRPAASRASSCRRTGSPSIRAATSTSARYRSPTGVIATRTSRCRRGCEVSRSSSRCAEERRCHERIRSPPGRRPPLRGDAQRRLGRARRGARRRSHLRPLHRATRVEKGAHGQSPRRQAALSRYRAA